MSLTEDRRIFDPDDEPERNTNGMTSVEDTLESILREAERYRRDPSRLLNEIFFASERFPELLSTALSADRIRKIAVLVNPKDDAKDAARNFLENLTGDEDVDQVKLASLFQLRINETAQKILKDLNDLAYLAFKEGRDKNAFDYQNSSAKQDVQRLEKKYLPQE